MHHFRKWAEKEYSLLARAFGTLAAGVMFALLIPIFISKAGPTLDQSLSIQVGPLGVWPLLIGAFCILTGAFFAIWSVADQVIRARGTPVPIMATQKLLITGPFKLCRNPMSFGTILLYSGIGIIIQSPSALAIVIVFSGLLMIYIKRVEERELEARFGEAYLDYKQKTPFIFPRNFGNK